MKRCLLIVTCLALGGLGTYLGQSLLQGQAVRPAAIPAELTSYRDVVKKVLPAVVSIESQSTTGNARQGRPGDMQLPGGLQPFFDRPRPVDDDAPARIGFGSGFISTLKGVVVTNNHVVEGADRALVRLSDGRKFTSSKIRTDPKTDLAIVLLDRKLDLPALEFGDSTKMEIGDRVLAVGAPFGLDGTVTHGIISSKGRSLRMNMYEDFLQTDAAINPGNSGGPLVSLEGKVIGINSAIKSRSGGFQGIGLAIASNLGKTIVTSLFKEGVVRRGYLGVSIRDVDEDLAKELGLKKAQGVQITRIFPKAPGAKAGLKKDDVITKLGKKPVRDGRDLQTVVAGLPLGKPVKIEIVRNGKPRTLDVTIEEQPRTFGSARPLRLPEIARKAIAIEKVGLSVVDMTPELAEALGYPDDTTGVLVFSISRKGLAALAGIKPGAVILSVNKKEVKTAKEARDAIVKGSTTKGITLEVRGPKGDKQTVVLRESEDNE
jgi:serine protease Do